MSIIMAIYDWLGKISPVIWSGVIAAGISLYGVKAANKSSLDRLALQHEHDLKEAERKRQHEAAQNAEDRKVATRREVYLDAVEKAHALLSHLGRLPDTAPSADDLLPLQAFLVASSKVWLVADVEAVHLSRELVSLMAELSIASIRLAGPYRSKMEPAREAERKLKHALEEVERSENRMSEAKDKGAAPVVLASMATSWREANDYVRALQHSRAATVSSLRGERVTLGEEHLQRTRAAQLQMVKLVSALRVELDLPPELEAFLSKYEDTERRALAAIRNLAA